MILKASSFIGFTFIFGLCAFPFFVSASPEKMPAEPLQFDKFKEDRPLVLACMNALRQTNSIGVPTPSFYKNITRKIRKAFSNPHRPQMVEIDSAIYFPLAAYEDLIAEMVKRNGKHLRLFVIDGEQSDQLTIPSVLITKAIFDRVANAIERGFPDRENSLFLPLREEIRVHGDSYYNQASGWHHDGEYYTIVLTISSATTVYKDKDGKDIVGKKGNILVMTGNQRKIWAPELSRPATHRSASNEEIKAANEFPRIVYIRQVVKIY